MGATAAVPYQMRPLQETAQPRSPNRRDAPRVASGDSPVPRFPSRPRGDLRPRGHASPSLPSRRRGRDSAASNSSALHTCVEVTPGLLVSQRDVTHLLERVSSPTGQVVASQLGSYLEAEGIFARPEEVEEMIRMLGPGNGPADTRDQEGAVLDLPTAAPGRDRRATAEGAGAVAGTDDDALWAAFLNRCFAVGEGAVRGGVIEAGAVSAREAYVMLALPAITLLDMCSAPSGSANATVAGVMFATGFSISAETAPTRWRSVVAAVGEASQRLWEAEVHDPTFRAKLRLACAADPEDAAPSPFEGDGEGATALTAVKGLLMSAAVSLTQTERFRESFEGVLELIEATM